MYCSKKFVLAEGLKVESEGRGEPVVLSIEVISPEVKKSGRVSCMTKMARPVESGGFLSSSQTADLTGLAHPFGFPTLGLALRAVILV